MTTGSNIIAFQGVGLDFMVGRTVSRVPRDNP
jgi:hypothetical protein